MVKPLTSKTSKTQATLKLRAGATPTIVRGTPAPDARVQALKSTAGGGGKGTTLRKVTPIDPEGDTAPTAIDVDAPQLGSEVVAPTHKEILDLLDDLEVQEGIIGKLQHNLLKQRSTLAQSEECLKLQQAVVERMQEAVQLQRDTVKETRHLVDKEKRVHGMMNIHIDTLRRTLGIVVDDDNVFGPDPLALDTPGAGPSTIPTHGDDSGALEVGGGERKSRNPRRDRRMTKKRLDGTNF